MGDSKVRIIVSVLLALPVVVGLFMVMHSLIDRDFKNPEVSNQKIADLVQPDEEIQLETNSKKPEKVEDPEEPPPEIDMARIDLDMDTNVDNIAPAAAIDISISTSGMSSGDGEYLPIVKVAPIYPRRAQTRGISGYCIVEYTVTTSGAIRDPVAVDCQPSGVFEKASVKASTKFKYKPRVVDGEAIEVAGVQNKFTYELEQ
ncbi:MAG: energy transducer TonB [Halioglobus sp.]|jgi:protein TonB|uniref:Protein TonB n=1 Tax=Candidatus Seongchinamella marina TaxID=2518990 RepID=A0ABT3SVA5_9GAMM|nr:energy transducer TonB [Candidatus Seongchinamella marina]EEB76813.1 Gram-negative bacterial tonB protein [marine gamma proteobacterium HTCC2148]MBT3409146.1 energy transducer TonB [Halieaceae bacterium]MDG1389662.1 energy transducer TonB [Halioglobus sp.]MBT5006525.1 energy transducer TonB [Halieaceae bacterium]MBT6123584.1 energy transducer TonB [Halieaceae bacterium]